MVFKKAEVVVEDVYDKVAIYSSRNVFWQEVGRVSKGYNIMTKDQADLWLTRNHTRLVTPLEVAKEFGI
jgi:hypothetical protein